MKERYLILADKTVIKGYAFGADTDALGELVFTTGMCGYIETLTDPSYFGQIVIQTFPMIGNYGIIEDDFEGKCELKGYVVREYCDKPSNFRCDCDLDTFLKKNGIPGIYGIDTRQLTRIIREHGVTNAIISDTPCPENICELDTYTVKNAVDDAGCKNEYKITPEKTLYRVGLIDYGAKKNIARELEKRGCEVTVLPPKTPAEDILDRGFDGIMLSNGPGDPAENTYCIEQIKKLYGKLPIFGICLGHQILALACGAKTVKLKYGHRGANQPAKEVDGARTYITSQNHGYAVEIDSIKCGKVSYVNANDGSCEGIDYPDAGAFSVQFHPEACSGPRDTSFLFDKFILKMKE